MSVPFVVTPLKTCDPGHPAAVVQPPSGVTHVSMGGLP
jgi:hypothetical protein